MIEQAIYDTGFLFAVLDEDDDFHDDCLVAYEFEDNALLPVMILPEIAYLIKRELRTEVLIAFLRKIAEGKFNLAQTTEDDFERAAEILEQYDDNNIDLVDAVIVAMAERLKIKRILTVDRRHFSVFKPKHATAFEIIP